MAAKKRSNTVPTGHIARHVAKVTGHAFVRIAELVAVIHHDTHDGDNNFSKADAAMHRIEQLAVYGCDTQWEVADGDYTEAKRASENLLDREGKTA